MGDVHVCPDVPRLGQCIAQFDVSPELFEAHVGPVSVCAVIRCAGDAGEPALAHPVGGFCLERVIGTVAQVHIRPHTLRLHFPRDDVDDTAHGVRTIEHGSRPAQHFHAFGQRRLVGIRDGMPHEAHVLRVAVDEYHYPSATSGQSPQADAAGSPAGHAVAHDAARGDEESRHLFRQHGQQGGIVGLFYLFASDDGHGGGGAADVGFVACAGHHYFVQGACVSGCG